MTQRETSIGHYLRIAHGFAFKGEHFSEAGKYVVLTPGNFHEGGGFRARPEKDRFYSAQFPEKYLLGKGDLIVAMTEQGEGLLGSAALVPQEGLYLHNQRIGLVTLDPKRSDKKFFFYLLNTPEVRRQIRNSSSGTKVRHTSPERIYRVKAAVPRVEDQRRIAAVLSAYDDLIENNRQRIALLERMAEQLYREWFVRFRFPGYQQATFKKGRPADWGVIELKGLAREASKATQPGAHLSGRKYVPLDLLETRRMVPVGYLDFAEAHSSLVLFEKGDILFGAMRPYLHKVVVAPFAGITRTTTFVIRPRTSEYFSYLFLALHNQSSIDYASMISNGSDRPYVVWNRGMERMPMLMPPSMIVKQFDELVRPMIWAIADSNHLIEKLARARDLLLPRLISGKLRVDDLDIQFPPSMQDAAA